MTRFHSHDGWYFERQLDGGVAVYRGGDHTPNSGELMCEFDINAWASILACMSSGSEIDGRFYAAREFHLSKGEVSVIVAGSDEHRETELAYHRATPAGRSWLLAKARLEGDKG